MNLSLIQTLCVVIIPVIFAITMHEAAHAFVAKLCGDNTAYLQGRVTANPLPHIDPIGTIAVPLVTVILASLAGMPPFLFGWAKPVPINTGHFRSWRRDQVLVSLAGPMANILMAIIWAFAVRLVVDAHGAGSTLNAFYRFVYLAGSYGIMINLVLVALNLIPLPPLDGSRVIAALLPTRLGYAYNRLEPYGLWILVILIFTGTLQRVMLPMYQMFRSLVRYIVGY